MAMTSKRSMAMIAMVLTSVHADGQQLRGPLYKDNFAKDAQETQTVLAGNNTTMNVVVPAAWNQRRATVGSKSIGASDVADWATIAKQVKLQAWSWTNADDSTTDLSIYGNALSATFGIIGAVQGLTDGAAWDDTLLAVGGAALPFITMVNPFLGLACGLFMSFFGGSASAPDLGEILNELYAQIMADVQNMITEAFADHAYRQAKADAYDVADYLFDNPNLTPSQLDALNAIFYTVTRGSVFYNIECLTEDLSGPREDPTDECIEFQKKGALTFQLSFATIHLNVLLELARLAPDEEREQKLGVVISKAHFYSSLLQASLDTWKLHSADVIPKCEYDYPKGWGEWTTVGYCVFPACTMVSKCGGCFPLGGCGAVLPTADRTNPYSGESIPEAMGCNSLYKPCLSDAKGNDISYREQYKFKATYPDGMCTPTHFETYLSDYRAQLESAYGPAIQNMSQVGTSD